MFDKFYHIEKSLKTTKITHYFTRFSNFLLYILSIFDVPLYELSAIGEQLFLRFIDG
jgi:hypothetical protein